MSTWAVVNPRFNDKHEAVHDLLLDGVEVLYAAGFLDCYNYVLAHADDDDIYDEHGEYVGAVAEVRESDRRMRREIAKRG